MNTTPISRFRTLFTWIAGIAQSMPFSAARILAGVALLLAFGLAQADVYCSDDEAGTIDLFVPVKDSVTGKLEYAYGMYAAPSAPPTHLIVIGHGAGHTIESWRHHAEMLAEDHGYLVVAMEYRDMVRRVDNDEFQGKVPETEENAKHYYHDYEGARQRYKADGWPVRKGGEDLNAAARTFLVACPTIETSVLTGISMGVAMTGWALSHNPSLDDGTPLYDYWLAIEGVHNLIESYFEDRTVNHSRSEPPHFTHTRFIEEEAGSPENPVSYEQNQDPYEERTNILQAPIIATSGIRRVFYVHAVYDGLVPYWQSRAMASVMGQVPFEFYTVTLRRRGEDGTVIEDYVIEERDIDFEAPLAGHAKESREEHVVMRASFDRLADLIAGIDRDCGEYHTFDSVSPESPTSAEDSEVVNEPVPGQTYDCAEAPPRSGDVPVGGGKANGGGWLRTTGDSKINFGFEVKTKGDQGGQRFEGHVSYRDRKAGVKIKIGEITAIGALTDTCGSIGSSQNAIEFHGIGTFNGTQAEFRVCAEDNGEGNDASADRFVLSCLAGCRYHSFGAARDTLEGGNVQVHEVAGQASDGSVGSTGVPAVLILEPMLDDDGAPGTLHDFTIIAIDGDGTRLQNALVDLRQTDSGGSSQSIAVVTGADGIAIVPIHVAPGTIDYAATTGSLSSNRVELTGLAQ